MIIEICAGIVAAAFVVLVVYLVIALRNLIQTLKRTKSIMNHIDHITIDSQELIKNTNDLTLDFKEKSEALNVFFRPLAKLNKKKADSKHDNYEKIAELIDFATEGIVLFNKLKKK
jgi:uncharacterized protein YoxC